MKLCFLVEDCFGQVFFPRFFHKKNSEGVLGGRLERVIRCPIGSKMGRMISANVGKVDRAIVIADADGESLEEKMKKVLKHVKDEDKEFVKVVLLDHEIEEWICHSEGIRFGDQKPSDALRHHKNYTKNQLPRYAERLDCEKLQGYASFKRLVASLKSSSWLDLPTNLLAGLLRMLQFGKGRRLPRRSVGSIQKHQRTTRDVAKQSGRVPVMAGRGIRGCWNPSRGIRIANPRRSWP